MSTLSRAVIRAYNSGTHKADVQLATSVPTHLTAIPVATDIPPAYVVAGRECAVLTFDDNPDNAVVVTVHGAVPGSVGDLVVDDQLAVGPGASIQPTLYASIANPGSVNTMAGLSVDIGGGPSAAPGNAVAGILGRAIAQNPSTVNAFGLDYIAGTLGVALAGAAYGCRTQVFAFGPSAVVPNYYGYYAQIGAVSGATLTNWHGFYVPSMNAGANRRAFFENGRSGAPTDSDGNRFRSNTQFASTLGAFGGGDGVLGIANAVTVPTTNPAGGGILYASAGALLWRGSAGTVTTIAPA